MIAFALIIFFVQTVLLFLFSDRGLYVGISITFIAANIQFLKEIALPLIPSLPLGTGLICCNYFAMDLLNQFFGKEKATNALQLSLCVGIFWNIIFLMTGFFTPSDRGIEIDMAFEKVFSLSLKAFVASYISYFISQSVNIFLFNLLKRRLVLYFRSLFSSFVAGFVDYFCFLSLFYLVLKGDSIDLFSLFFYFGFVSYLLRVLISLLTGPFLKGISVYESKIPR